MLPSFDNMRRLYVWKRHVKDALNLTELPHHPPHQGGLRDTANVGVLPHHVEGRDDGHGRHGLGLYQVGPGGIFSLATLGSTAAGAAQLFIT